jgi:hypothetical protein
MRAVVLAISVWLAPFAADAQLVRAPQPTNVAFAASSENGMLVVAEGDGTSYAPGRYRFVRIDREARRALGHIDIEVGPGRGQVLFGRRPEALPVTHTFHYVVLPAGDYALVYWDSSANNVVSSTTRRSCLTDAAPIYVVAAGAIAVVRTPDRIAYDLYRDNGFVRRPLLRRFPQGTTVEHLTSEEKTALDFAEIVATNTLLTAQHSIAPTIGALAFEAPERARLDECLPGEGFSITLAQ